VAKFGANAEATIKTDEKKPLMVSANRRPILTVQKYRMGVN